MSKWSGGFSFAPLLREGIPPTATFSTNTLPANIAGLQGSTLSALPTAPNSFDSHPQQEQQHPTHREIIQLGGFGQHAVKLLPIFLSGPCREGQSALSLALCHAKNNWLYLEGSPFGSEVTRSSSSLSKIVELLAGSGAFLEVKNLVGRTPLIEVSRLLLPVFRTTTIKVLTDLGVSVNASDAYGRTALHHAASEFLIDNVEALVEAGARGDVVDREGLTPLHLAAKALGRLSFTFGELKVRGRLIPVEMEVEKMARVKLLREEAMVPRQPFACAMPHQYRSTMDLLTDLLACPNACHLLGEQDVVGHVLFGEGYRGSLLFSLPLTEKQRAFAIPHARLLVEVGGAKPLDLFSAVYLGMPEVMEGIVDKWVAGGGSREGVLESTLGGLTPLLLACSLGHSSAPSALKLIAMGARTAIKATTSSSVQAL